MYVLLIILVRETVVKVQLEPLKYLIAWEIFQKNAGIGEINLHDYLIRVYIYITVSKKVVEQ